MTVLGSSIVLFAAIAVDPSQQADGSEATDLGDNYSFSNDRLALVIAPLDRSQEKDYEGADNVIIR
ncbi:hypothetical protein WN943_014064 [Citrus x changshan-huyou]